MSNSSTRATWDEYFLELAATASTRGTCVRRKHGAVVVKGRRIVATGYNGGPAGYPHCEDGGCPRAMARPEERAVERCIEIHAEANALLFTSPDEREGATLYSTDAPCFECAKLIANSGIGLVIAAGGRYDGWTEVRDLLRSCGVRVRLVDGLENAPRLEFPQTT